MFGTKTVDSVLGTFTKAIADLEAVRARELQSVVDNEAVASEATARANAAASEAGRALNVATKISELVS
jgi:hypothetical protein